MAPVQNDDKLLSTIGDTLRIDDDRLLELLEAMGNNTATEAQRAEIAKLAHHSEEIRIMVDLCAPQHVAQDQQRVVERLSEAAPSSLPRLTSVPKPQPESKPEPVGQTPAQVISLQRPQHRRWFGSTPKGVWLAAGVALAAVILLFVFRPDSVPTLPEYSFNVITQQAQLRGTMESPAASTLVQLAPDDVLTVTLRPATGHSTPTRGAMYQVTASVPGTRPTALATAVAQGKHGVLKLKLEANLLPLDTSVTLAVVLAPEQSWSDELAAQVAVSPTGEPPWQRLVITVVRKPTP